MDTNRPNFLFYILYILYSLSKNIETIAKNEDFRFIYVVISIRENMMRRTNYELETYGMTNIYIYIQK